MTSQKSLLSKGFKFVPSRRKVDIGKLIADIQTWVKVSLVAIISASVAHVFVWPFVDQNHHLLIESKIPYS
jgi:C4-dicarboxylate transporter